jgi:hypothetical protein
LDYKEDKYDLGPKSLNWIPTLVKYISEISSAYRLEKPKDKSLRRFCAEIDYTLREFNKLVEIEGGELIEVPERSSQQIDELAGELREYLMRFFLTDVWEPDAKHKNDCRLHRWINFHGKGEYTVCDHLAYIGYVLVNVTYGTERYYPEPHVWLSYFESSRRRH